MRGIGWTLLSLAFLTITSLVSVAAMFFMVDPEFADRGTLAVFYAAVFVSILSAVAWIFLIVKSRLSGVRRPMAYFFSESMRHGVFIAAIITASLYFQAQRQLTFFVAVGLVGIVFLLETLIIKRPSVFR